MRYGVQKRMMKKIRSKSRLVLYGAGGVGKQAGAWLKNQGIMDFCYAVSDKRKNPEQIDGILVRQIEELIPMREEALVIVATMPALHREIRRLLDKLGFRNKVFVNERFLKSIGIAEVNGVFPEKRALYYERLNCAARKVFCCLPCRNIIVFESKIDYTDNCRALSEYIEKTMPGKYQIVWIVKDPEQQKKDLKTGKIYVNRRRMSTVEIIKLNYYISRAKFFFFTHPGWLTRWRPEQKVVNLGHGNPLKKAEPLPHVADCVLASGEDGIRYRKLEYKGEMRVEVLGPPRNDWLSVENMDVIQAYTGGKRCHKVILCLPTYKQYETDAGILKKTKYDSRELNEFCLNTIRDEAELAEFNRFLKERDVLLLCKQHYLQKLPGKEDLTNIKYIDDGLLRKNGHDIYHVLAGADALVTDFSSIYMDYLLLDRPVGFFFNSVSEYTRGFALEQPERYMPGMKLYDTDGLKRFVSAVTEERDEYKREREEARNLIFQYQDHQNCRRCAEYFKL